MTNNNGDNSIALTNSKLSASTISALSANTISTSKMNLYDYMASPINDYSQDISIDDVTGREMLEVIQRGVYKTLVTRRDDAKALWEEEDDDASYGEYKALKDAVELMDAFLKQAPKARYSGLNRRNGYDRYDGYGRRY